MDVVCVVIFFPLLHWPARIIRPFLFTALSINFRKVLRQIASFCMHTAPANWVKICLYHLRFPWFLPPSEKFCYPISLVDFDRLKRIKSFHSSLWLFKYIYLYRDLFFYKADLFQIMSLGITGVLSACRLNVDRRELIPVNTKNCLKMVPVKSHVLISLLSPRLSFSIIFYLNKACALSK